MTEHPETFELSAFIDGELDAAEHARIEAHVPGCAECTATIAALRATIADVESLPPPEMDAEQIARLDAAIERERSRAAAAAANVRRTRWQRLAWASGGVAASLIAVVGLLHAGGLNKKSAASAGPAAGAGAAQGAPLSESN